MSRSVRKYSGVFSVSARSQLNYLPAYLARNIFFIIIVFIFYSLWRVIFAGRPTIAGLSMTQTLWYLTFTEAVELSKPRVFAQIQEEVKDGTIAYSLVRPYSYLLFTTSRFFGEGCVRMVPILIEGFVLATLATGLLPGYFAVLPAGLMVMALGLLLNILWMLVIGIVAFWIEEVAPIYWILQKLVFILGGMFFPIDFFPNWLQGVARALPFAFSAYWPARVMVAFSPGTLVITLAGQAGYSLALGLFAVLLFAAAKRRVHVQGG